VAPRPEGWTPRDAQVDCTVTVARTLSIGQSERVAHESGDDLETLPPKHVQSGGERLSRKRTTGRSRLPIGVLVLAVAVVCALIGAVATYSVTRSSVVTRTVVVQATTTTAPLNLVYRTGESARLDGWTVTVKRYSVVSRFAGLQAPLDQKWLVARTSIANDRPVARVLGCAQIAARYAARVEPWREISGCATMTNPTRVGGRSAVDRDLMFGVPTTSSVYSVVFRPDLLIEKQQNPNVVEVDLNCC
jgi:hypothetical protein